MSLPSTRLGLRSVAALVVDDNPQALDVLSAILMGFGVNKITRCQSAAEAKTALARQVFDLIIVDWEMPEQVAHRSASGARGGAEGSGLAPGRARGRAVGHARAPGGDAGQDPRSAPLSLSRSSRA
ncbi:response regulator [Brevundimonas balnearis]|uniref:Response regulator n=1 Tax=Brevundimonas balnearis TaxID=1572858 RepID=A0ABV6R335_9CAUL